MKNIIVAVAYTATFTSCAVAQQKVVQLRFSGVTLRKST
jgi:hypothetical protein